MKILTYRPPSQSMGRGIVEDESGQIIAEVLDVDATGYVLAAAPDLLAAAIEAAAALQAAADIFLKQALPKTAEGFAEYAESLMRAISRATPPTKP